jgi:predicted RNA binding protein YcfA (HicA-like mRNA interferase family)
MPHFGPIKRRELVACLRRLGYSGPFAGGRHEFMQRGNVSVTIQNPHKSDIGPNLLAKVLRQAGITRDEWESL